MLLRELLDRLRETIRNRIRNGQITERALARRVGLSQTHIHHVMKGARMLTPEVADALLNEMGLSLADLMTAVREECNSRKSPGREETLLGARNLDRTG